MQVTVILALVGALASRSMGSWTSGGTELMGDQKNPWFLSNSSHASYCILLDEKNSGVSREQAAEVVKRAFDFWARDLQNAILPSFPDLGTLRIAPQVWDEQTCMDTNDRSVDLRFQFGVINEDQKEFIKTPSKYAAITVRTDYDKEQLRGKGFIYVSPVRGELTYQGAIGKPDIWAERNGIHLYHTLLHELGHVYGLPHTGAMPGLMAENFADSILDIPLDSFEQFFGPARQRELCPFESWNDPYLNLWKKFFAMTDPSRPCLRFKYDYDSKSYLSVFSDTHMSVYAVSGPTDSGALLGSASLQLSGFVPTFGQEIELSPLQKVFSKDDLSSYGKLEENRVLGISLMRFIKRGSFHTADGRLERSISVSFEQGNPRVSGIAVLDGQIYDPFF